MMSKVLSTPEIASKAGVNISQAESTSNIEQLQVRLLDKIHFLQNAFEESEDAQLSGHNRKALVILKDALRMIK